VAVDATSKRVSFAAGEAGTFLRFREDLQRWQVAVARLENMVVLLEGGLTRAPGTRFVKEQIATGELGLYVPFRFSGSDSYMLDFNGQKMTILKDGGFLPFELAVPYLAADLANLRWQQDRNLIYLACRGYEPQILTRLGHTSWTLTPYRPAGGPVGAQNLDPATLIRASGLTGTVTLTGSGPGISFTAAAYLGGVVRLDENDLSKVPLWQANETIAMPDALRAPAGELGNFTNLHSAFDGTTTTAANRTGIEGWLGIDFGGSPITLSRVRVFGTGAGYSVPIGPMMIELRVSNSPPSTGLEGKVVGSISFASAQNETGGRDIWSGDVAAAYRYVWVRVLSTAGASSVAVSELTFYELAGVGNIQRRWNGNVYQALTPGNSGATPPTHTEGDWNAGPNSVIWRFLHPGYGFVRITAVNSASVMTGEALSRLPDSVASDGTYRWYPPGWSAGAGWPEQIAMHQGRLVWGRQDVMWLTRPSDPNSLEILPFPGGTPNPDSAIEIRLRSLGGSLPWLEWAISSGVLLLGLRDDERILRATNQFEALTIDKAIVLPAAGEGSTPHVPARVDDGVIFIGRSRKRLHYGKFDHLPEALDTEELTIGNRQILDREAYQVAFARDPNRLLWVRCADGMLASVAFMPKQQLVGWGRRYSTNGVCEQVAAIATSDEGVSECYVIYRRTINGAPRRYCERMEEFFEPRDRAAPTAEGAWFVDSAIPYSGPATTTFTGLSHLANQTARVFADGARQADVVVSGAGTATIQFAASEVVIGLPLRGYVKLLPIELELSSGTTKGKTKGVHHLVLDLVESAGGRVRVNGGKWENLLPTGAADYGQPIKLFTGTVRVPVECEAGMTIEVEIECDHALPFTLAGVTTELKVG
jgi:hypothetical protein